MRGSALTTSIKRARRRRFVRIRRRVYRRAPEKKKRYVFSAPGYLVLLSSVFARPRPPFMPSRRRRDNMSSSPSENYVYTPGVAPTTDGRHRPSTASNDFVRVHGPRYKKLVLERSVTTTKLSGGVGVAAGNVRDR